MGPRLAVLGSGTERDSGGAILCEAWATDARMVTPGRCFGVLDQAHRCELRAEALRHGNAFTPARVQPGQTMENGDEALGLEMLRLCHLCATDRGSPFRTHHATDRRLRRRQFCN